MSIKKKSGHITSNHAYIKYLKSGPITTLISTDNIYTINDLYVIFLPCILSRVTLQILGLKIYEIIR